MRVLLLILAVFMTGCSANWHLRTALRKDPTIRAIVITETVDTFKVSVPIQVDKVIFRRDTFQEVVFQDSTIVKYIVIRDTITGRDSIAFEVDCPDCNEVVKTVQVKETLTVKVVPTWGWILIAIAGGLILFQAGKLITKIAV